MDPQVFPGGGNARRTPKRTRFVKLGADLRLEDRLAPAAPVACNDGPLTVHVGEALNVSAANGVLGNDTDADNDALSVGSFWADNNTYVSVNTDGSFTFIGYATGSSGFTYQATDGVNSSNTATVSITVIDAPPPSINSVILDNYTDNYTGVDDRDTADDVITAQVDVSNSGSGSITYQYIWTVDGQTAQTTTTTSIVDSLDMTVIGEAYSGKDVAVSVNIVGSGDPPASAFISDQTGPNQITWASPRVLVYGTPTTPNFPQASYTFNSSEGAPKDFLIGQVTATCSSGDPVAYAITAGNPQGYFKIDANGKISVSAESLPLTATTSYSLTVTAAHATNPGLAAYQRSVPVQINLHPTVVITGDFQCVAASIDGVIDGAALKFVRVAHDLDAPLTVLYSIDWNGINPSNAFVNSGNLANTLPDAGQVTFGVNQSAVTIILTPLSGTYTDGVGKFTVQLDPPGANGGYVIPPSGTSFFIPSMVMTGFDRVQVQIYDAITECHEVNR